MGCVYVFLNHQFGQLPVIIDLSHILTNKQSRESISGWIKIQQTYENVHPNLALGLLFARTAEVVGRKVY